MIRESAVLDWTDTNSIEPPVFLQRVAIHHDFTVAGSTNKDQQPESGTPQKQTTAAGRDKYQYLYDLAQKAKTEMESSNRTILAHAVRRKLEAEYKRTGGRRRLLEESSIKRRLDQHFPGWADTEPT